MGKQSHGSHLASQSSIAAKSISLGAKMIGACLPIATGVWMILHMTVEGKTQYHYAAGGGQADRCPLLGDL